MWMPERRSLAFCFSQFPPLLCLPLCLHGSDQPVSNYHTLRTAALCLQSGDFWPSALRVLSKQFHSLYSPKAQHSQVPDLHPSVKTRGGKKGVCLACNSEGTGGARPVTKTIWLLAVEQCYQNVKYFALLLCVRVCHVWAHTRYISVDLNNSDSSL